MIFKLIFEDDRKEYCTAKDILHLLKSYDSEFDLIIKDIESLTEITDEEAKLIMVANTEYNEDDPEDSPEICLFDLAVGNDFAIIASSEYD